MSEIYRTGTAPAMPKDGKCDMATNDAVDDCRGEMCDACAEFNAVCLLLDQK